MIRIWPICNKKQLQKHLREYIKLTNIWRDDDGGQELIYKMSVLDNLILQIREEIKYYE